MTSLQAAFSPCRARHRSRINGHSNHGITADWPGFQKTKTAVGLRVMGDVSEIAAGEKVRTLVRRLFLIVFSRVSSYFIFSASF
jgi:hypothetical protein